MDEPRTADPRGDRGYALDAVERALRNAYGDVNDVWPSWLAVRAAAEAARAEVAEPLADVNLRQHEAGEHTVPGAWPHCPRCSAEVAEPGDLERLTTVLDAYFEDRANLHVGSLDPRDLAERIAAEVAEPGDGRRYDLAVSTAVALGAHKACADLLVRQIDLITAIRAMVDGPAATAGREPLDALRLAEVIRAHSYHVRPGDDGYASILCTCGVLLGGRTLNGWLNGAPVPPTYADHLAAVYRAALDTPDPGAS